MRAHAAISALLAAAVALPLSGCFGMPSPNDLAGQAEDLASQAEDLASQAQELADTFSNIEWGKVSRLVVKDAKSGKVIREVTDQAEVEKAFESLSSSSENDLAEKPDADAEYVFELWQPETQKLGQSADDLKEVKACEVTTYEGSPVITIEVSLIDLPISISSQATADSLRALAE